ncbi:metallophosphoesterase, partial [Acidobacteriota bacterium]
MDIRQDGCEMFDVLAFLSRVYKASLLKSSARQRRAVERFGPLGAFVFVALLLTAPAAAETVLVDAGTSMAYSANSRDPRIDTTWTEVSFDDSSWASGTFGVGYEADTGAENLIQTAVDIDVESVYSRVTFSIPDVSAVQNLFLGADYDDGYVAWLNGTEVLRSSSMPPGPPAWNTASATHESSNGAAPYFYPLQDITAQAIPVLNNGDNLLAIGVWSDGSDTTDLVLVPHLAMNLTPEITRGPYVQVGTPSEVTVRWRTNIPADSDVRFGTDPLNLTDSLFDETETQEHELRLTGLTADTSYHYTVGTSLSVLAGNGSECHIRTSPEPGMRQPVRVWVIGDSGTGNSLACSVRDAYMNLSQGIHTDLWLMVGDNAYNDGTEYEFQTTVFDIYPEMLRTSVLWPAIGNHDARSAASATQTGPYYDAFTMPKAAEAGGYPSNTEAYYSFDYANIHFICLDSTDSDRTTGSPMLQWLDLDLAGTTQDWIIAYFHHPPYTKGSHDSDVEQELIEIREHVIPVLEDGGVDLVLSGHSHSYERSMFLDGHYGDSTTLDPGMILNAGNGRADDDGPYRKPTVGPIPRSGAVYMITGSSGRLGGGPLNHPVMKLSIDNSPTG